MNILETYNVFDVEPVNGLGSFIWDKSEVRYLDMHAANGIFPVGHNHPEYINKVGNQLNKFNGYAGTFTNRYQQEFGDKLGLACGYKDHHLLYSHSAFEAMVSALKIAFQKGTSRKVVVFEGSSHSNMISSLRTITNTRQFITVANYDIDALMDVFEENEVSTVLLDGTLIDEAHLEYYQKVKVITEEADSLLVLDETFSGCGRTGKFFAHQHVSLDPDITIFGESIGNGFSVAGLLVKSEIKIAKGVVDGGHTAYAGGQLACIAGLAVLDILKQDKLMRNADLMGHYVKAVVKEVPGVKKVKGLGLLLQVEMDFDVTELRKKLLYKHRVVTGQVNSTTLTLTPALNISEDEIQYFVKSLITETSKSLQPVS
jgi:acetylornithine aminotransferase